MAKPPRQENDAGSLLDVTLQLGDERETKRSMNNFRSIANKDSSVASVEIKAGRNFQHICAKFMQEEMEGLLTALAGFGNLRKLSMKLLPNIDSGNIVCTGNAGRPIGSEPLAFMLSRTAQLSSIALVNVTLSGNADSLSTALQSHPSLQSLRMVNCEFTEITSSTTQEEPLLELFRALFRNTNLTTIFLTNNVIHQDVSQMQMIADYVGSNSRSQLESLTLKKCWTLSEDIVALMEALETNRSLKCLVLDPDETGLEDGSIFSMGEMLLANSTLQEISVRIPARANLMPIAVALKTNRSLTHLYFLGNLPFHPTTEACDALHRAVFDNFVFQHIGAPGARGWTQTIDFFLRLNRAGRFRLIGEENQCTRLDWVNVLIEHKHDLDVVYYFLSKNPAVCRDLGVASIMETQKKRRKLEG